MKLISSVKRKIKKKLHQPYGEILMLHSVVKERSVLHENRILEITPDFLEQTILKYKSEGYRFASLDKVQRKLERRKFSWRKFVCFTMDDGYANSFEQAYPVFKKHNCPFAIYITTDYPDKKAQYWWYQLEDALLKNEKLSINGVEYDCSDLDKKNKAFWDIREKIFSPESETTHEALKNIFRAYDCQEKSIALSWEQIVALSSDPLCTIGAHTLSHASLPTLSDEMIVRELSESRQKIEDRIKKPVKHFAYPYGNYDSRVVRLAREQFSTAVTVNWGEINKGDDLFMLNRKSLEEQ